MTVIPATVHIPNSNLPKLDKRTIYNLAKKLKLQGKDHL